VITNFQYNSRTFILDISK